jgi:hypothetical protein
VLDYVPKRLTDHQKIALKDLAKMIMADLELYRGKEMSGLKERMAFSITQFTRGPSKIHHQPTKPNAHRSNTLDRARRHNGDDGDVPRGWKKRSPSADRSLSKESQGVMDYYGLTVDQKTVDSLLSPDPRGINESASTTARADSPVEEEDPESTDSKQDEVDLRTIYRYACRLMRETLDIEGVCIIEIDWKYLTGVLKYRNDNNVDRDAPSHHDEKVDASSTVLGYSHSHQFGAIQRESWQPIKGWDDETLISINPINGGKTRINQSRHRVFTATDPSAGRDNVEAGRLSDHFVTGFISENVSGKVFNDGLPEAVSKFLPPAVAGAILVPLYDFDHSPFAITCAYSTNKHKKFLEEERQYLEVPRLRSISR